MVWSQYVWEANTGLDADGSDEDVSREDAPLNIEDWEVEYSDELTRMWHTIELLLYDAGIHHSGRFVDFVEFCHMEHDADTVPRVTWEYQEQTAWFEERLAHVWKHVRRVVDDNGLHERVMRGATFNSFLNLCKNYMDVY
jgi:hypothetical protein